MQTFSYIVDKNLVGIDYLKACPECLARIVNVCSCTHCDKAYPSLFVQDSEFTCTDCRPVKELVNEHNKRAHRAHLPGMLTVKQWRSVLLYFDNKCAYGGHKYEALEHFVPITKGGGTIMGNCVPACLSCNTKKGNSHPDKINHLFPPANLARIREYLTSVAMKQSA